MKLKSNNGEVFSTDFSFINDFNEALLELHCLIEVN